MKLQALAMAVVVFAVPAAAQQQDFSQVEVKAEKVAEGLYMLTGRGGNIGLSVGKSARPAPSSWPTRTCASA